MLRTIHKILLNEGLTSAPLAAFDMNIHWGYRKFARLRSKSGDAFFIKLGGSKVADNIKREYNNLQYVHDIISENVPVPLTYSHDDGVHILVLSDVPSHTFNSIEDMYLNSEVAKNWITLFQTLNTKSYSQKNSKSTIQEQMILLAEQQPILFAAIQKQNLIELASQYGWISQHGDLAINNLGLSGEIPVIYDWEDYGLIGIPGFDTAILLASLVEYDFDALMKMLKPMHPAHNFIIKLVASNGISFDDFITLLPLYYSHFLWLKYSGNYDSDIQTLIESLIFHILEVSNMHAEVIR